MPFPDATRPTGARWTLQDIAEGLGAMRAAAGHLSYAEIAQRIGRRRAARGVPASKQRPARATVYDCFRTDRRRLDVDLVVEIARALGADDAHAARWARACRVAQSRADAATVVAVHADPPARIDHFVGRESDLQTILRAGEQGSAAFFSIEGMPGSGKSQLAIVAARRLLDAGHVDAVLHADLRGFRSDDPPADPTAVLDASLRILGVPARETPVDLAGSTAIVLVTSRTRVSDDAGTTRLALGTFTAVEGVGLLREIVGADRVDLSYAALSANAQTALRLLAAHPCADLDAAAVAALIDSDAELARDRLGELLTHHVLAQPRPDRYALHALIRIYALDRSYDEDRPTDRDAAVGRLCGQVVATAWRAHDATSPAPGRRTCRAPDPIAAPELDEDAARSWLTANIENVLALAAHGADLGQPSLAVHLSEATASWLNRFGRYQEARRLHQLALAAARASGDALGEARAELDLGQTLVRLNDWDTAGAHLDRAGQALADLGDHRGAASAFNAMAIMAVRLGRLDAGLERLQRALILGRLAEDTAMVATTLDNLAVTYRRAGQLDEALNHHLAALDEAARLGDVHMQATGLINMSEVQLILGAPNEALRSAEQGLAMGRDVDNPLLIAYASTNIGNARSALNEHAAAVPHHLTALAISREVGDRHLQCSVHNNVGHTYTALGHVDEARRHFEEAHAIGTAIDDSFEQARALDGAAAVLMRQGAVDDARQRWTDALAIFESLGSPEATALRASLSALTAAVES